MERKEDTDRRARLGWETVAPEPEPDKAEKATGKHTSAVTPSTGRQGKVETNVTSCPRDSTALTQRRVVGDRPSATRRMCISRIVIAKGQSKQKKQSVI